MAKILLIESDLKSQIKLKLILTYKGFEVTISPTITEARFILKETDFELILIDIHNQEENTFYFTNSLRNQGCYIPVLYIGERSYEEILYKHSNSLDCYLLSPYNFSDLNLMIHKSLLKTYSRHGSLAQCR